MSDHDDESAPDTPEEHKQMQQAISRQLPSEDMYRDYVKQLQPVAARQLIQNITVHPTKHKQAVMSVSACADDFWMNRIIIAGGTEDFFGKSASKQVWSWHPFFETFNPLPDLPTTVYSHRMVHTANKTFIIGGLKGDKAYDTVFVLEHDHDEWQTIQLDVEIGEHPSVCASENADYIHIVEDNYHLVLDTDSYEVSYIADTPFKVYGAGMCEFDEKLYLFGGYYPREYKNEIYMFDYDAYEWERLDVDLPVERAFYGCVRYHQYALIIGGYINKDILVFDLERHVFIEQALALPKPISRMSVALLNSQACSGGEVHVFAGMFGGAVDGIDDHLVIKLKDLYLEAQLIAAGFCREIDDDKNTVDGILRIMVEYLYCD
eukprot:684288_1